MCLFRLLHLLVCISDFLLSFLLVLSAHACGVCMHVDMALILLHVLSALSHVLVVHAGQPFV